MQGNVSIRFLDWSEALGPVQTQRLKEVDSVLGQPRNPKGPPGLGSGEGFHVVVGSDLLYEVHCHSGVDCLQVCITQLVSKLLKEHLENWCRYIMQTFWLLF